MSEDRKTIKGITPKGVASWPRLHEPDVKFKPEGEYSIKLRLSGAAAAELVTIIDGACDEAHEAAKKQIAEAKAKEKNPKKRAEIKERADVPYKELYENDEPTGDYEFNFKMKASGVSKKTGKPWARKPAVFNAKGAPLSDEMKAKVGGGSVVKVAYEITPFYTAALGAGVSLRLEAVQVLEIKSFQARDASAFGFGAEEGYEDVEDEGNSHGFTDETADGSSEPTDGDF